MTAAISTLAVAVVLLLFVAWLRLLRPAVLQRRAHVALLAGLKRGDSVATVGGLLGVVTDLEGKMVELRVSPEVKVYVLRSHIAGGGMKRDTAESF